MKYAKLANEFGTHVYCTGVHPFTLCYPNGEVVTSRHY